MPRRALRAAAISVPALVAAALVAPNPAVAAPGAHTRHPLPRSAPAWTAHARHLGPASGKAGVQARVYLAPRGGTAALAQAAVAVSTPGSASYGAFLTPAQYAARYTPTADTVAAVRSWLTSSGLRVTGVEQHNRYLTVSGSVAEAQRAFGTRLDRYTHNGQTVQAPAGALTVPDSLASSVLTVTGLDTTAHRTAPNSVSDSKGAAPTRAKADAYPAGFRNARPCSRYYGQVSAKYQADYRTPLPAFAGTTVPYAPCGYTGPQFRAAYEGATGLDGSGVTVAITDAYASPTIAKDAQTYAVNHGDGGYAPGQLSQVTAAKFTHQKACGPTGWYGEETLDVEAVHAMAPGANIRYYGAASCEDNDFLDTLQTVVDEDIAQLVSNSWGEVEEAESADAVAAYEQVFLQGAMEGISFMFSSGDNGDELANSALKQADYPTSDPYVTSVGGTATAIGSNGALAWQTGWGTEKYSLSADGTSWNPVGYLYGAGGGASALFNKPAYQDGVVAGSYRQVPDVAMDADPTTGMLVGETQSFPDGNYYDEYRIGGTSLASPLFAGMTALALQKSGSAVGLLNPTVYANASTGAFTDVKGKPRDPGNVRVDYANGLDASNGLVYSIRTFNQDSSLSVTKGWDDVTGVGSPNSGWLSAVSPVS